MSKKNKTCHFWSVIVLVATLSAHAVGVSAQHTNYQPVTNSTALNFEGIIGKTLPESQPAWPDRPSAPDGAPNILIWLIDDAGFGNLSPYGSPIETPTVQALADQGLTFTDFHSVPLCSPARAAFLAGRNHHSIAMGSHVMSPSGFPGYNSQIPKTAASVAKVLKQNGYATWAIGKWDQTPIVETSVAGPFDSWPSGQGFERFYGFLGGEAHHFEPSLWSDHSPIAPSEGKQGYFLTTDLADKAIEFIGGLRAINQEKPFLLYWSTGAVHAPHHAPKSYIDKYDAKFSMGWDELRNQVHQKQLSAGILPPKTELSPKRPEIPDWDSLSLQEKRLFARQMAAFAGQLEHTDHEFGRIVSYLEKIGELDNTIIIVTSDNGASAEGGMTGLHNEALSFNSQVSTFEANNKFYEEWGGPNTVNHMHAGWAMASNTPFPFYKHQVEGGGTHVPMVIHWPDKITQPGIRTQYHHIIDIVPTLYEMLGIDPPEVVEGAPQQPLDGISFVYTFDNPNAEEKRTTQYYEIWGNRGIYKEGWKAATIHNNIMPWEKPVPGELTNDVWRLYHVDEDFSQSNDLAAEHPDKLRELQDAWAKEASRYGVYPVDPNRRARFIRTMNKSGRKEAVIRYHPEGAIRIPEAMSPPVKNKDFSIVAQLHFEKGVRQQGIIATSGGVTGGYALYVEDGYPVYVHNLYNEQHFYVKGNEPLPVGSSELVFSFTKNETGNGGTGTFYLDGQPIGSGLIEETTLNSFSIEDGFDIGQDQGSPVSKDYQPPFPFSGTIVELVFDLREHNEQ